MSQCAPVCRKLKGRTALIIGGDSGISWAADYGAGISAIYYDEELDTTETEEID